MADFLRRINKALSLSFGSEGDWHSFLSKWNADLEEFVQNAVQNERHGGSSHETISDGDEITQSEHDSVIQIFESLRKMILALAYGKTLSDARDETVDDTLRHEDFDWRTDTAGAPEKVQWSDLSVVARTAKNWWRWYIQLYLPSRRQYSIEIQARITRQDIEAPWRSKRFLEFLLNLLEELSLLPLDERQENGDVVRMGPQYVTQLFFYVTYPLSPNDLNLMDSYHYLVTECSLMDRFLNILTRHDTNMQLRLSIIRNVHNALASFPQQSMKAVTTATFVKTSESTIRHVEWMTDDEIPTVTFKSFLKDLAFYLLTYPENENENNSIKEELIVEILRCCYALRIGADSTSDEKWQVLIEKVLCVDATNNDHIRDGKLAMTCILMENASFRQYLSTNSMESLLQVLDDQVTHVLHENYIDDRAAAALNPILAVLYKCCVERPDTFAEMIRKKVFPDIVSDREYDENLESPKNMSPIDTPEGTLRWKLIQLLTWPNSFVKRLTGELLFLLCHNKQQEFIHRVGIGNAVAILSLKGLIDLPPAVHS